MALYDTFLGMSTEMTIHCICFCITQEIVENPVKLTT